jgi:hypothetical protein
MILKECTICGAPTSTICKGCKSAAYCSRRCQRIDLGLHKVFCKNFQDFLKTRPEPKLEHEAKDTKGKRPKALASVYLAAILFPQHGTMPEFVWLNYLSFHDGKRLYQTVERDLLKYTLLVAHAEFTEHGHDIQLWMGDKSRTDSSPNECLDFLIAGYEDVTAGLGTFPPLRWGGDNIAICRNNKELVYRDATLSDLRYALDWFTQKNACYELEKENPYIPCDPEMWFRAVKISSSLEMQELGKKKYREVLVARNNHVIFQHPQSISGVAKNVGFSLLAATYEPNFYYTTKEYKKKYQNQPENQEITFLMINPVVPTNGARVPAALYRKWDGKIVATTLVAREDRRDITVRQVEALVCYAKEALTGAMNSKEGRLSHTEKENAFKEYMDVKAFGAFFADFKQKKLEEGDTVWAGATVPPKGSKSWRVYSIDGTGEIISTLQNDGSILSSLRGWGTWFKDLLWWH